MCEIDVEIAMPNLAALRAAVFPLSRKNLRGHIFAPPPGSARASGRRRHGTGGGGGKCGFSGIMMSADDCRVVKLTAGLIERCVVVFSLFA